MTSDNRSVINVDEQRSIQLIQDKAENDATEIDLLELFYRIIEKFKLVVVLAIIGALIAGAYSWFVAVPKYEATSMLYILNSEGLLNLSDLQIGTNLTADYIKVFDIRENREKVIEDLGLKYTPDKLGKMIRVNNPSGTRFLELTVTSVDPKEAVAIADDFADVVSIYISTNMTGVEPSRASRAIEPINPVSPNKTRNVIIGFMLGAILAVAIISIAFITDTKVKTAEDVRKATGLPTLAVVPLISSSQTSSKNSKKKKKGASKHE